MNRRGGRNAYTWADAHPDKVSCDYADNRAVSREALAQLGGLAKTDVPLLHGCGSRDPWLNSQTRVPEKRYRDLGGQVTVVIQEGAVHLPTAPKDLKPVVEFITRRQPAREAEPKPRGHRFDGTMSREVLSSRGEHALFWGDVMHHSLPFAKPDWNSVSCNY
jgi:hypothetical protein